MLERSLTGIAKNGSIVVAVCGLQLCFLCSSTSAFESLGIGTDALIGGDLTDVDNDGDSEFYENYDAIFDASHEPGFGSEHADPGSAGIGESAFNVFDNLLGPANDKWCCGKPGGMSEDNPIWVSARFPDPHFLTSFTVSSANDGVERDPIHWAIQGSNGGESYTDIYVYKDDEAGPWKERLEVLEFTAGDDFPIQTSSYEFFRFAAFDSIFNREGQAAYFQIGEIEYFGTLDGGFLGDFNDNGVRDPADFDLLAIGVADGDATFDLDGDGKTDAEDLRVWVEDLSNTYIGDSNWDGEFDSADFVAVFTSGKYRTGTPAGWAEGDWNGDNLFNASDFVIAFTGASYEQGPRPGGLMAVPEPANSLLVLVGVFGALFHRVRSFPG